MNDPTLLEVDLEAIRRDGGTQIRATLSEDALEDYARAYAEGRELPPVVLFDDGADYWLADGFHRVTAALRAGLVVVQARIHKGDRRAAVLFAATEANGDHGVRMSRDDKRRAVETLLADPEWSTWSNREIARRARVSHEFVSRVRRGGYVATSEGEGEERRRGRDGKTYPVKAPTELEGEDAPEAPLDLAAKMDRALEALGIGEEWRTWTPEELAAALEGESAGPDVGEAVAAPPGDQAGEGEGEGEGEDGEEERGRSDEWYTPRELVEAARAVMGGIDLDPATSDAVNRSTVRAPRYFTKDDDGLAKRWEGRVWMNPPFSRGRVWIEKLLEEYRAGNVTEACALVIASTGKKWFRPLWAHPVAFLPAVKFTPGDGRPAIHARENHVIVYLGPNRDRFVERFVDGKLAHVIVPSTAARGRTVSRGMDSGEDALELEARLEAEERKAEQGALL